MKLFLTKSRQIFLSIRKIPRLKNVPKTSPCRDSGKFPWSIWRSLSFQIVTFPSNLLVGRSVGEWWGVGAGNDARLQQERVGGSNTLRDSLCSIIAAPAEWDVQHWSRHSKGYEFRARPLSLACRDALQILVAKMAQMAGKARRVPRSPTQRTRPQTKTLPRRHRKRRPPLLHSCRAARWVVHWVVAQTFLDEL